MLLHSIHIPTPTHTTILCDNNSAINLSEDPPSSLPSETHRYQIPLRECVQSQELVFSHVGTKDNVADIFTKALEERRFLCLCSFLGLK